MIFVSLLACFSMILPIILLYRSFDTKATILHSLKSFNRKTFALVLLSKSLPEIERQNLQNTTNKKSSSQEPNLPTVRGFTEGSEAGEQLRTAPSENHFSVYSPRNAFVNESTKADKKTICPLNSPFLQGPIDVDISSKT